MKDVSKLDVSLSGIARTAMVRACIMAPLAPARPPLLALGAWDDVVRWGSNDCAGENLM